MDNKRLMDMPALFSFPNHVYMAITEAAVRDYAGMYLWKKTGLFSGNYHLTGTRAYQVEASLPINPLGGSDDQRSNRFLDSVQYPYESQ